MIRYPESAARSSAHGKRVSFRALASEDSYNPLFSTLPKALKIDVRGGASREWIETSVRFAANELAEGRLASSGVIARLSESLLTEAVRQYASTLAEEEVGWLKGVKDPHIGRALALIHHGLDAPWRESRTFAQRLCRALFVARRYAADPVSHLLAAAEREAQLARNAQDNRAARLFGRL